MFDHSVKLAYSIWRNELITPLSTQLVSHIIELIARLRSGQTSSIGVNTSDIRGAVLSFVEVNEPMHQEQKTPFSVVGDISRTEACLNFSSGNLSILTFSTMRKSLKETIWNKLKCTIKRWPAKLMPNWIVAHIWNPWVLRTIFIVIIHIYVYNACRNIYREIT